jgi:tRNA threonylcarbamoyladenosine biosynthesis protein TsaE
MTQHPLRIDLPTEADTTRLGQALALMLGAGDCVLLEGSIGAGKSHLARALIRTLRDPEEEVPSPTFTLVQPYDDLPVPVWHVDLYRLDDPREADALGLFETDAALLIEWPERLGHRLPPQALRLTFSGSGDAPRRLTWDTPPAWEGRWPPPSPR